MVDQLIIDISNRLKASIAPRRHHFPFPLSGAAAEPADDEILARLDGDQFTVLLESIKDPSDPCAWPCGSRKAWRHRSPPTA